jgi:carotenoid cleavage dioxygenase-like enzyme
MGAFPQTPYFTGLNEPVGQEVELKGLRWRVRCRPKCGSFFRAVPDPAYPPKFASDHTLSGDGMAAACRSTRTARRTSPSGSWKRRGTRRKRNGPRALRQIPQSLYR